MFSHDDVRRLFQINWSTVADFSIDFVFCLFFKGNRWKILRRLFFNMHISFLSSVLSLFISSVLSKVNVQRSINDLIKSLF